MVKLRRLVALAASALAATLVFSSALGAPSAVADPLSEAKSKLAALEEQSSKIEAEYNQVQTKLATSKQRLKTTTEDLATQEKLVASLKTTATRVALAQFQSRGVNVSTQILTSSDVDSFLSQLSTTQQVEANMNSTLQDYQSHVGTLESLKKTVASETSAIAANQARLKELKTQSESKVTEAEALVSKLSAKQRAAIAAEQQQTDRTASQTSTSTTPSTTSTTPTTATGSASSRALAALAFAKAQIGKSYRLGATGPSAYDCSGLVKAAYASVGISLPRTSQAQFGAGRAVSRSELQPGDLVFFYSGISHVGIYMGNGVMVDARNSRVGVVYSQVFASWWPYAGARRVA